MPTRVRDLARIFATPKLTLGVAVAVAEDAERLVRKAFAQGYIQIVTPGSQLSPSSLEIKWEEELRALIKGKPFLCEVFGLRLLLMRLCSPQASRRPRT